LYLSRSLPFEPRPRLARARQALVSQFIRRCNDYADAEVARYRIALQQAPTDDAAGIARKIADWQVYRAFNEYTLAELETTTLDTWFD
jgi:hypothetical protein